MKSIRITMPLLLCKLLFLAAGFAQADDLEAQKTKLIELADAKRPAAIKLKQYLDDKPRANGDRMVGYSWGVFISEDGLAIIDAKVLIKGREVIATQANGQPLKFGKILGLFPNQELALMKFDHQPENWLQVAAGEPELNEQIVVVIMDVKRPLKADIPAFVGPVMAKRSAAHSNIPGGGFARVLSLGGRMSQQQDAADHGAFAINDSGELVAMNGGDFPTGRNLLIHLSPLSPLADEIQKLSKAGKAIPYPLPKELNPLDPVTLEAEWGKMMLAFARKDADAAFKAYYQLFEKNPKSGALKGMRLQLLQVFGKLPAVADGETAEALVEEASPMQRIEHLGRLVREKTAAEEWDEAIALMKQQIAIAPKDYPHFHEQLGDLCMILERPEPALEYYRQAYQFMPESIALVEKLENLFNELRRYKEADRMSERLYELERIYR